MNENITGVEDFRFDTEAEAIKKRDELLKVTDISKDVQVFFDEGFTNKNWFCRVEIDMTDEQRNKLQGEMWDKLMPVIERLYNDGKINKVQYVIGRDVLYDTTVDHEEISYSNNIAQDFIDDEKSFMEGLWNGYVAMKSKYPDIDGWSRTEINEHSTDYRDYAY